MFLILSIHAQMTFIYLPIYSQQQILLFPLTTAGLNPNLVQDLVANSCIMRLCHSYSCWCVANYTESVPKPCCTLTDPQSECD